jgi:hypothetical protein
MSEISINFKIEGVDDASTGIKKLTGDTDKLDKAVSKNENSVKTYGQQIKALQKELIALGSRTTENAAEFDTLSTAIVNLKNEQEDLTIGTTKLEAQLGTLPGPIGNISKGFDNFDRTMKNTRGAFINLTKQFPLLNNAFVASGVGAIIVIFGLLAAAVIKAFNSFEPLKVAVGNLGIAFKLVGKILDPLVNLIGRGLTRAIEGASRAIAFLTGNMAEYNKEVEKAANDKRLKQKLEDEQLEWELIKDNVDQYTRSIRESYNTWQQQIQEIKESKKSEAEQDRLIAIATQQFQMRNAKLYEEDQKRRRESLKLSKEELEAIKRIQETNLASLRIQLQNIKALSLTEVNVKILADLEEQFNKISDIIEKSQPEIIKYRKSITDVFSEIKDVGFEPLINFIDETQQALKDLTQDIDFAEFDKRVQNATNSLVGMTEVFNLETILNIRNYGTNIQQIGKILEGADKIGYNFYQTMLDREKELTEQVDAEFSVRDESQKKYNVKRAKFIEDYAKLLQKEKNITIEASRVEAENLVKELDNIITTNKKFADGVEVVNKRVKTMNEQIRETIQESGALDLFVEQNKNALLNIYTDTFGIIKLIGDDAVETTKTKFKVINGQLKEIQGTSKLASDTLEEQVETFRKNLVEKFPELVALSQMEINRLFVEYKTRSANTTLEINEIYKNLFDNNLQRQLRELKNQENIDAERLKQEGATQEQITMMRSFYSKRREQIERDTNLMIIEMSIQTLSGLTNLLKEESELFKAMKFFEASVMAITSAMRAFDWGMEYGGPKAPIIAPILASAAFSTQMIRAYQILTAKPPETKSTTSTSSVGANPTYTGYYEQGGRVYGKRHSQGGVMAELEGDEYIINRRSMMVPGVASMAMALNNIGDFLSNPSLFSQAPPVIKTYVLSGEITSQQRADKRINQLSRL